MRVDPALRKSYAAGLATSVETIIKDTWNLVKMFKGKLMPPTAAYKCRSLIMFACLGELLSLIMPKTIAVSMAAVLEKSQFTAFYCVCGSVC
jgi:hypothetical protein